MNGSLETRSNNFETDLKSLWAARVTCGTMRRVTRKPRAGNSLKIRASSCFCLYTYIRYRRHKNKIADRLRQSPFNRFNSSRPTSAVLSCLSVLAQLYNKSHFCFNLNTRKMNLRCIWMVLNAELHTLMGLFFFYLLPLVSPRTDFQMGRRPEKERKKKTELFIVIPVTQEARGR